MLAVVLWAALQQAPDAPGDPFVVHRSRSADGSPRITVEADRSAISCLDALRRLAAAVNWNVDFESSPLEADLRFATVDLNLAEQPPLVVAQLIAVAGGADVVFDAGDPDVPTRPSLHVVRPPDEQTEAGRQRLRAFAEQWYRSFLLDELRNEPLVREEATNVRMNLGRLLIESGDLETAIEFFVQVCDDETNPMVPAAMLRIAQCNNDLAAAERDAARRKDLHEKAEKWARKLLERYPSDPASRQGVVELGKALLGQERHEECRGELRARAIRLLDSAEILDVELLIGEADFRLAAHERVYEDMLTIRETPGFGSMTDRQFLDYHFLLGDGALGAGKPDVAMKALEWFLIRGPMDPRRGVAYTLLGESYMALDKYVEARAAAVQVRERYMQDLDENWRRRAIELYANSGLALGEKDEAFKDLEVLVQRHEDPELAIYLVERLIEDRQYQWAISVAERSLDGRDDEFGDRGRFLEIQAMFEQGMAAKNMTDFPQRAIPIVLRIRSPERRSRSAEMIGRAYEVLGKPEHAADAYRGILR
ncbi:MAG: hypothetical protein Fur0037_13000 [Planctomycetota bacterium]